MGGNIESMTPVPGPHIAVYQMQSHWYFIYRLYSRYVLDGYLFRVLANAVSRALLKWAIAHNLHGDNGVSRRPEKGPRDKWQ